MLKDLLVGMWSSSVPIISSSILFLKKKLLYNSVPDPDPNPDPPDPRVFWPPGSGSTSQRYGSGSGSFYHHAKITRKTLTPTIL